MPRLESLQPSDSRGHATSFVKNPLPTRGKLLAGRSTLYYRGISRPDAKALAPRLNPKDCNSTLHKGNLERPGGRGNIKGPLNKGCFEGIAEKLRAVEYISHSGVGKFEGRTLPPHDVAGTAHGRRNLEHGIEAFDNQSSK